MRIGENIHLGYSTNIHRGNSWEETFAGLRDYTLRVKEAVCTGENAFGIGLRLSNEASLELIEQDRLAEFRRWLDANNCYVFTMNGFPYGNFHGTRVKEEVYVPDWQTQDRLDYTKRLFELLAKLLPEGAEGSVSSLPCSYKSFIKSPSEVEAMQLNLIECAEYIEALSQSTGHDLHLGLEPEPFGYLETTPETIDFFDRLRAAAPNAEVIRRRIGVNYDTCHMAIQFEEASESLSALAENKIRISKLHLSSALSVRPNASARQALQDFVDSVYLHQVVGRNKLGEIKRWEDLDQALATPGHLLDEDSEWRIHFHVPLYAEPETTMGTTVEHLKDSLDFLAKNPGLCRHFEFETYTWEVLPAHLRTDSVIDQLVAEYQWCFGAFA